MSEIIIGNGSTSLGGGLNKLMEYDAPGGELSYEMAKIIFTDHVLGRVKGIKGSTDMGNLLFD